MRNTSVGIRDAKTHLSRYLKLVQAGEEVIITDHGRPVEENRAHGFQGADPARTVLSVWWSKGCWSPSPASASTRPPALPVPKALPATASGGL